MFKKLPHTLDMPKLEQEVLERWSAQNIFAQSTERPAPNGDWIFYEGPPTANGSPGVHHVISRAFKDLFPRFKTMQGYRVSRKGGWDTHGLPVEIGIEKKLGFTRKQQIEEYGIEEFNKLCREDVFSNIQEWNAMTERIGFWIDLEHPYITYDNSYIESCWWIMKSFFDRGLLTEDYKTTWHSPSSNTTLASHEVSLGYKENTPDPSVYPKFAAKRDELVARGFIPASETRPVYFLAWTTTPWTLPANTALSVLGNATYVVVEAPTADPEQHPNIHPGKTDLYLIAEDLVAATFGEHAGAVIGSGSGNDLAGATYDPLFTANIPKSEREKRAYVVVADDFVSLSDGTGIVHTAPAYGDDEVGRAHGLATYFSVDLTGNVMPEVTFLAGEQSESYAGQWFKDADTPIANDLLRAGLLYSSGTILHTYPFNWRDGTPLMNVAKKSWYIKTSVVKDLLLKNNNEIGWHPDHIRTGRFGRWLENNVDWALSRERYWGAPLPIWQTANGEKHVCVGSVAELSALTGKDLSNLDLHRPYVDDITFEIDGETYTRVPYTIDVWFESGAMPYAQWHYLGEELSSPEAKEKMRTHFPADYICEAIDQTRGWFYSLHAIATLLTDPGDPETGRPPGALAGIHEPTSAFKNVNVLGHILDENGEKMSKSKGNIVDPWTVLNSQGADALRWYLYSSNPPENNNRFSVQLVEETLRDFFMTLWNVYGFFVMYANLEQPDLAAAPAPLERPLMDRWLLAKLEHVKQTVTNALEDFNPTTASRTIRDYLVDDVSNWYVRRNRRRFWRTTEGEGRSDSLAAYATLHHVLVTITQLMAPLAPFLSDEIFRNLTGSLDPNAPASVHLSDWPTRNEALVNDALLRDMAAVIRLAELGRSARAASGVKLRQPLPELLVRVPTEDERSGVLALKEQLLDELNVKAIRFLAVNDAFVDYDLRPNLPRIGKRLGRLIPAVRQALAEVNGSAVVAGFGRGEPLELRIGDETITLTQDDLLLDAKSPEGFAAEEAGGYLVALNTEITPELRLEGLMRDAVRVIQAARKNAGFDVADRVHVTLTATGELHEALAAHASTVAEEVLATELTLAEQTAHAGAHQEAHDVDGEALTVSLSRAEAK